MTEHDTSGRSSLFPDGIRSLQLYWSPEVLADDVSRCRSHGWKVIELDAGSWLDADAVHTALAEELQFPTYYGRNLDALDDAMVGIAEGRYGFAPDVAGGVLVFNHIDQLLIAQPRLTEVLVDVLAITAARALRFGWPLACFLQSDDPDLQLHAGPPEPIGWNRTEQTRAARRL